MLIAQVVVLNKMLNIAAPSNQDKYDEHSAILPSNIVRSDGGLGLVMEQGSEELLNAKSMIEKVVKLRIWQKWAVAVGSCIPAALGSGTFDPLVEMLDDRIMIRLRLVHSGWVQALREEQTKEITVAEVNRSDIAS